MNTVIEALTQHLNRIFTALYGSTGCSQFDPDPRKAYTGRLLYSRDHGDLPPRVLIVRPGNHAEFTISFASDWLSIKKVSTVTTFNGSRISISKPSQLDYSDPQLIYRILCEVDSFWRYLPRPPIFVPSCWQDEAILDMSYKLNRKTAVSRHNLGYYLNIDVNGSILELNIVYADDCFTFSGYTTLYTVTPDSILQPYGQYVIRPNVKADYYAHWSGIWCCACENILRRIDDVHGVRYETPEYFIDDPKCFENMLEFVRIISDGHRYDQPKLDGPGPQELGFRSVFPF